MPASHYSPKFSYGERARQAPWSLFAPHEGRPFAFFLDRSDGRRPSFAGSRPSRQLVVDGAGRAHRWNGEAWSSTEAHPLDAIEAFVEESRAEPCAIPERPAASSVIPRTVGYLAYELGAWIEDVPVVTADPVALPLAVLSTYDSVDAWDPTDDRIVHVEFDAAPAGSPPTSPTPGRARPLSVSPSSLDDDSSLEDYRHGFGEIMAAIARGDVYQANLSRRISRALDGSPAAVYRRLRARQPVPHGSYMALDGFELLGNSPECFLLVEGERIHTFPIKGTRARRSSETIDHIARAELTRDPKELAEHVMIVDLERNDLGRVCEIGSVRVARFAEVHSFATVHHLVSHVSGRLRSECGLAAVLRATFPGGSITGAPKVKAMELIATVEPVARGVYTGAVGCFNGGRSVDLNVAIRTAVACGGRIHYSSGGGIVADSREDAEYEETVTKARAFIDSLADDDDRAEAAAR